MYIAPKNGKYLTLLFNMFTTSSLFSAITMTAFVYTIHEYIIILIYLFVVFEIQVSSFWILFCHGFSQILCRYMKLNAVINLSSLCYNYALKTIQFIFWLSAVKINKWRTEGRTKRVFNKMQCRLALNVPCIIFYRRNHSRKWTNSRRHQKVGRGIIMKSR